RSFRGELNDTETAKVIGEKLPIESDPSFWGDEIYFEIPVDIDENENPEVELVIGDLAYWPDGHAFCIFYGPTPSSDDSEPRPASPVTVVGELSGDATALREFDRGNVETVKIEVAD
ncbi:MAG: cyclophilin-like fold protein, partial [Candidatus Bipolaricaulia bacterium]